jgi:hypothetical protein
MYKQVPPQLPQPQKARRGFVALVAALVILAGTRVAFGIGSRLRADHDEHVRPARADTRHDGDLLRRRRGCIGRQRQCQPTSYVSPGQAATWDYEVNNTSSGGDGSPGGASCQILTAAGQ